MFADLRPADEISGSGLKSLPDAVANGGHPMVLRGAVRAWPFVQAALQSDEAAALYLARFYNGQSVGTIVAPPSERGRFFYRADSKRMNFERSAESLSGVLQGLLRQRETEQPFAIAMQAILAAETFPGLQEANPNPFVPSETPARLWIGNRVTVAPHFDVADNLACVTAGRRRFILFPPEQTANLYPGPMDITPARVPISMVSLDEPEFDRFPRYREALDAAFVAELEPGDAVYIPYLWWHGVQSLSSFNVLTNYWWNRDDAAARHPYMLLLQLTYALYRGMRPEHRSAWRALYDHYVFQGDGDPMAPLAPTHRDPERPIDRERSVGLGNLIREILG
ncbi:MAG TPA: cupin-like domain-containing protein [Sphingomicrobium sp.]|nr:cupin-like domain-containing protein [Sphingomicrobium sp.]